MATSLGVTMGDRANICRAGTVAPQLATEGAGVTADRLGDVFPGTPRTIQRGDLVALFQGQVPIVHVQLHLPVKRCRLRHLTRFNSRKLHFAV